MSAHTPGRLRVRSGAWKHQVVIETTTGEQVAETTVYNDEHGANAERLAHCWNCHDELVEALKIVLDCERNGWPPDDRQHALIRSAFTKAEGRAL